MFRNKVNSRAISGWFLGTTLLFVLIFHWTDKPIPKTVSETQLVKQQFTADLVRLGQLVRQQFLPLAERSSQSDSLKMVFLRCRLAYKKLEAFAEYYFPATTRLINGPPLPEIEAEDGKIFEPGGFQVIEELLYPTFDPAHRRNLIRETKKLQRELGRIQHLWADTELTDANVFDALRLEVFRVTTLGISGFDNPLCQTAMPEAASSLASLRTYTGFYGPSGQRDITSLQQLLEQSERFLTQHPDFNSFDRAKFIINFANLISSRLLAFQQNRSILPFDEIRALRTDAASLFASNAFNPDFYAPTPAMRTNPAKVVLGKKLFSDPILSVNERTLSGQRSCASCHWPGRAFTDGLPKNLTLSDQGFVRRNTPTLLNAALQNGQFYDLRSPTLENQSSDVIHNPDEMHGSLQLATRILQNDRRYQALFKRAFPQMADSIQPVYIQNALAAYERSLISLNSRFDRLMRGEQPKTGKPLLSTEEVAGFNLFMGKAKCGTCHFLPFFNGTVPPGFTQTESEVIGVPTRPNQKRIDPDLGRYARFPLEPLRHAFKTPTVRNIALTGPYMHNGSFRTLEEVIDFYDQGGGRGLGIPLDNQTLSPEKLQLTQPEKKALIAFLKSLNDTVDSTH